MPIINLADQVREIPVTQILEGEGFQGERQGQSIFFKNDVHAINVTGQKWYDHKNQMGGYGAIDLAMFLNQSDFRTACLWLSDRHGSNQQTPLSFPEAHKSSMPTAPNPQSFVEQKAAFAVDSPAQKNIVWDYLTQTRGIDQEILVKLFEDGSIKATHSKDLPMLANATFSHKNMNGETLGLSTRSVLHKTGWKGSLGSKSFAWFNTGDLKNAKTVVISESPIDALSLASLSQKLAKFQKWDQPTYLSVNGNSVPENLIQTLVSENKKVVLALDSDVAGIQGIERAKENLARLGYKGEPEIIAPIGKDWNSDLLGMRFPERTLNQNDRTQEEIRQINYQETLEIARKHKAGLLLDRAKEAGFHPSRGATDALLDADWKTLKTFEYDLKQGIDPFKQPISPPSTRVERRISDSPSRGFHL